MLHILLPSVGELEAVKTPGEGVEEWLTAKSTSEGFPDAEGAGRFNPPGPLCYPLELDCQSEHLIQSGSRIQFLRDLLFLFLRAKMNFSQRVKPLPITLLLNHPCGVKVMVSE